MNSPHVCRWEKPRRIHTLADLLINDPLWSYKVIWPGEGFALATLYGQVIEKSGRGPLSIDTSFRPCTVPGTLSQHSS